MTALLWASACTRKQPPPPAEEHSSVEPAQLDLWAGVPALGPSAEALRGELVPKPGPAKPEQVGEEIELPFPPPERARALGADDGEPETEKGPLKVLRFGPEGEQALVESIRASFNHAMVPLASIEALRQRPSPLTIEPEVPGEFRWMGTRTVAFYPEGRLPYSTQYEVRIPIETASEQGAALRKAVAWTITTPKLALEYSFPFDRAQRIGLDSPIVLRFNQSIDKDAVAAAVKLRAGGKSHALELVPESSWETDDSIAPYLSGWLSRADDPEWERARTLVLRASEPLAVNTTYSIELAPGVYGEGPLRSPKLSTRFSTYPPLKLSVSGCGGPCSASQGIQLLASNAILDARASQKVHVSPEVEGLEVSVSGRYIQLRGDFVGESTYRVTVDTGLEDRHGQALAKEFKARVKLGALQPGVRVFPEAKHPGIIEASAGHTIQLEVTGLTTLELMASSFNNTQLADYRRHAGGSGGYRSYGDDTGWPTALGAPKHQKVLKVGDSRKRRKLLTVNLDDYLEGSDTFVYLFARSELFEYGDWSEREVVGQVIQVTDIGLSAAFGRKEAVVMVTSLHSGAPLAGAKLRLLDDNGRTEVWSGRSDAQGIARPSYHGKSLDSALLHAQLGDDEVFLPLDANDLEGRWNSYIYGRRAESEVRAFMFTERVPYKPGERIHLTGVLRREETGPEGGVSLWGADLDADYRFTSPRGVEVAEGKLKISPLGTFSIELETDENGDTGDYSFELMTKAGFLGRKARNFHHAISVEAFRTPEFEVEVERGESSPLYYGDELEVEVRGRYLFGAPMIGADVHYTLYRHGTDFRPPGEGLGDFHFASTPGHRFGHYGFRGGFGGRSGGGGQKVRVESKVLDERGLFVVRHALAQLEPPKPGQAPAASKPDATRDEEPRPQAATFTVEASVTDDNRQSIQGKGSFVVHPAAYYIGLRSERTTLREGEQTKVEALVVDVDGKRVEGVEIELRALRKQTTRDPVERDGVWTYDYETSESETSSCALRSAKSAVSCMVSVGESGTHEIVAELRDAEGRRNRAVIEIYVTGDDAVIWDEDQKRVDLVADKPSYEPGDIAKILVRSPFDEASGLLVVEREGIAASYPLEVHGGVTEVEVEISAAMVAGVNLSAVLTKPRTLVSGVPSDQDLGAPAAASGQLPLEVSKASKTIAVNVTPERDEIAPGETLHVELDTQSAGGQPLAAAVALFVVDEGVLNLMGYQTPDPLSFFHRRRAGEVGVYADHPLVLPREVAEQPEDQSEVPSVPVRGDGDVDVPYPEAAYAVGNDDDDIWGGLGQQSVGEAYGVGGLGLVGTGRGGGGTGEGTIGLGNTGTIGYGSGGGKKNKESARPRAAPGAAPPPPPSLASNSGIDANQAMAQEVSLRSLFASTAYFEAEVRTDKQGRASVEIPMPENLTSFRIMAVAIDPEVHDRFGSGEASVRVRKAIMLRPSLPRFLNLGDRFEASVMVDNQSGSDQTVLVGARGLNVAITGEAETSVEIPAGGSREVRFPMAVEAVGSMRVQFAALANKGRDATQLDVPVLVPATKQAFADYGLSSGSVQRSIEVPKDALPGFGGLEVSMSSTALNGLEDAVEYLVSYPYECSEQTASRLLPIFALGEVLDDFPIAEVKDRARRDALARDGIDRLLRRQNWDGGFGYWGDARRESWPYVSTWVTLALLEGKRTGHEVDADKLDAALNYLENYVVNGVRTRWGVYYDWTTRAFAVWLLSREGRGSAGFSAVWAKRAELPLYGRVLLASAAHRYKRKQLVEEVLTELRESVVEDARVIHFAESTEEAGSAEGLTVLMHSDTQTDAIVLMTLLELGKEMGDDGMAAKIMAGLMSDRDPRAGGRWSSTHATAWALMAASRYYAAMESETPDYLAQIWLDEAFAGEHAFAGRDMSKVNQRVPMAKLLASDVSSVTLAKQGPGKLYYRLGLRYAPADFEMAAVDRGFSVSRRYEALPEAGEDEADPEALVQREDGSWRVRAGTNVRVILELVVSHRANFVVVDDPFPAGFEGQNPRFLTSVAASSRTSVDHGYGPYGYGYDDYGGYGYGGLGLRGWWHPWYTFDHKQMRDDRMLLFADALPAGVYTYSYTARATNIGEYVLPPVHAEAMYEPERFGHGASSRVSVVAPAG